MTTIYRQLAIAAVGLIAAMALSVSTGNALEGEITDDVFLRLGPSADFPAVVRVARDEEVRVNGCKFSPGWCLVRSGGRHGWVPAEKVLVTGISRKRNNFEDLVLVIDVTEQADRLDRDYRNRKLDQFGRYDRFEHDDRFDRNHRYDKFDKHSRFDRQDRIHRYDRADMYKRTLGREFPADHLPVIFDKKRLYTVPGFPVIRAD